MSAPEKIFDVAIVGYGPVAEILAVMLGRQGRSVAIFERWRERYNLPRAVCIDHEVYRTLSAIGMQEELPQVSHAGPPYRWFNAEWQELLSIDWSAESISGGPEVNFIHQPTLEVMFDAHVRAQPTAEVNLGWEAVEVRQSADLATVVVENREGGGRREVSARFVIGCDGANSLVRRTIGGEPEDRGFEADWLVVDILPNEGVDLDIPPAAQWCNPARPTTIVPAGVRDGRYFRRWEFMRLPHETLADIEDETVAWKLLAPWVRPDQAVMVRHKVYTFRSLLARQWRAGRLIIAGDAAHVMPPFMGQGMCAGLRDAANLAWKLDLVLDGKADAALLDSYQVERAPHVSDLIDLSMYMGRMICQPDPAKAALRDAEFLGGTASPPPPFPQLTRGVLQSGLELAGALSPHAIVRHDGQDRRFDDVTGGGFVLVATTTDVLDVLSPQAWAVANRFEVRLIALAGPEGDGRVIREIGSKFRDMLAGAGLAAILIRPDFFVFGGAANGEDLNGLLALLDRAVPAPQGYAAPSEGRQRRTQVMARA